LARPNDRPTILFFHGNAHSVYEWARVREDLASMDCGLFLVEYTGYGKCGGEPSEEALYAAGRAWLSWLAEQVGPGKSFCSANRWAAAWSGKSRSSFCTGHHPRIDLPLDRHVAQQLFPMLPTNPELTAELYATIEKPPTSARRCCTCTANATS
jgi:hypothetical protein